MGERRSERSRRRVDYTKFEADNDDDFAGLTPPAPKKQKRVEKKEKVDGCNLSKGHNSASSDGVKPKQNRLPLDQKLYERDLQAALELSLNSSLQSEQEDAGHTPVILHSTPYPGAHAAFDKIEVAEESLIMPSAVLPVHGIVLNEDIEYLGTVDCSDFDSLVHKRPARGRRRKACPIIEEDQESSEDQDLSTYVETCSSEEDTDSDFDDSEIKLKSRGKNKVTAREPVTKPTARTGRQVHAAPAGNCTANTQMPVTTAVAVQQSKMPLKAPKTTSSLNSPQSPVVNSAASELSMTRSPTANPSHKPPAWTPPGQSDNSSNTITSLKSSASGLRLGLSRHARIKPLHPSLKVL